MVHESKTRKPMLLSLCSIRHHYNRATGRQMSAVIGNMEVVFITEFSPSPFYSYHLLLSFTEWFFSSVTAVRPSFCPGGVVSAETVSHSGRSIAVITFSATLSRCQDKYTVLSLMCRRASSMMCLTVPTVANLPGF